MTKHGAGRHLVAGATTGQGRVEPMPKVLIKRATMAGGKRVDAGQTVTVSEKDARDLIALGKAVPAGDNAPPVENRDQDKAAGTTKRATTKKKTDD